MNNTHIKTKLEIARPTRPFFRFKILTCVLLLVGCRHPGYPQGDDYQDDPLIDHCAMECPPAPTATPTPRPIIKKKMTKKRVLH